jgi:hypothetical protein
MSQSKSRETKWQGVYKLGGAAALSAVLVGLLEIIITFLPGGNTTQETVLDWFLLFEENPFMGLRNLGLLNIFLNALGILTYLAFFAAHRKDRDRPLATLAMIVSFLGIAVFFATNRAFPMLALSKQYAGATSDAQRMVLEAAGQSMLSVGQSHTPGTFLGFFFSEVAAVMISFVMLRSKIFSKLTAFAGLIGFGFLLIFEFFSSFITGLSGATMFLAITGGLFSMAWYVLVAQRLFQLGHGATENQMVM